MGDKNKIITLDHLIFENEEYFKISNHDRMRPFFMNIVSDGNHWMFISSNGGLTAGRKNPEFALFPYYTDDKITEFVDITGSKTIFQISSKDNVSIWEPFSDRNTERFEIARNLYKSTYGNKIIFEEVNHDLNLTFRYQWNTSNIYGFVKKAELINHSNTDYDITVLDGIQNVMPYGVSPDLQMTTSNLADAYKRNELVREAGLGIFALSAIIVDKAEPSEALKANVVWSSGFEQPEYLLSSLQLDKFRHQKTISEEEDIKAEKGAYFVMAKIKLAANATKKWKIVANVNQNHAQIISLMDAIMQNHDLDTRIQDDIDEGTKNLLKLNASADAIQYTSDHLQDARHFSNVLFNIMRGGIFDHHYQVEKEDFVTYLDHLNKVVVVQNQAAIAKMPNLMTHQQVMQLAVDSKDVDLIRLSMEYMPLKFSRRHGDPSRPWNKFSINTQNEIDGSKILDYEGNWRDIFQNWEALALSYPEFVESMIFKFVNATTFDGYNPYRVTKYGFDWETIEPDNPWSYIGYWGDHQVIYLLKFLEFAEQYQPSALANLLEQKYFVYANVPYRIKNYRDILQDPKNTISFDEEKDAHIRERIVEIGADGALLQAQSGDVMHVSFIEKLLAVVLSKMSNFIPEGGIWMNTQRPEWNDANNALVGNGVSMVTLYYLMRFFKFLDTYLEKFDVVSAQISREQAVFFKVIYVTLKINESKINTQITDIDRRNITDTLGIAGSIFRNHIYNQGFTGQMQVISKSEVQNFVGVCMKYIDHTINVNKRNDSLYHAYNLLTISDDKMSIDHLSEMLEGQVAVISSGYLSSQETLAVLDGMRSSALYRT
ncbi:MAG: hypothetical protein WAU01_15600, partial [Saprospiraceae bacterium]